MYAVIKTGGKQYQVAPGDEIKVERLAGWAGDNVEFDKVLLTSDGENVKIGRPYLEDSKVRPTYLCLSPHMSLPVSDSSQKNGGDEGTRTPDLYVANVSLSHLSYIPTF